MRAATTCVELGFNYRIDEPRATLAIKRLARLDGDNALRARAAASYRDRLAALEGVVPALPPVPDATPANHLFTIVLSDHVDRDELRERVAGRGVQTSLHYPPVHRFTAYDVEAALPRTDEYAARAVTLPMFPTISEQQIGLVVDSLEEALAAAAPR